MTSLTFHSELSINQLHFISHNGVVIVLPKLQVYYEKMFSAHSVARHTPFLLLCAHAQNRMLRTACTAHNHKHLCCVCVCACACACLCVLLCPICSLMLALERSSFKFAIS